MAAARDTLLAAGRPAECAPASRSQLEWNSVGPNEKWKRQRRAHSSEPINYWPAGAT